ncbi:hypothetical protein FGO68_gene10050 [Halteria grandinella]|uniref:Uncharacterized protein n=1 Tax=Halteria grandinella TaxID=5974 RepID=A0A8J8SU71_HALGN|nr:hypothetical protein FGO68_gene10050 [Halteria grandinella]
MIAHCQVTIYNCARLQITYLIYFEIQLLISLTSINLQGVNKIGYGQLLRGQTENRIQMAMNTTSGGPHFFLARYNLSYPTVSGPFFLPTISPLAIDDLGALRLSLAFMGVDNLLGVILDTRFLADDLVDLTSGGGGITASTTGYAGSVAESTRLSVSEIGQGYSTLTSSLCQLTDLIMSISLACSTLLSSWASN